MSQYTQGPQGPQDPYGQQYAASPHPAPQGQPPLQPQSQAQARNGLGIAALILGLVGAISGIIPLLFWLAGVLGLIALVLGLAGRGRAKRGGATNKGVATVGAVLGLVAMIVAVIGAVITFRAVGDAVDSIDKAASGSSASASPAPGHAGTPKGGAGKAGSASKDKANDKAKDKAEDPAKDKALAPGDTAVYDDDLNVTVGEPQAYSPGPYAVGHKVGNHAYKVTVTITNKGSKKYDATLATVAARAGSDGREAAEIYDDTSGEGFSGQVLPGKKATQVFAFDAPADAKALTVQVTPGFSYNETQWDLPL